LGERHHEARSGQRVQIEHSNGHSRPAAPSTAAPSTAVPRTAAPSTGRTMAVECLEETTLETTLPLPFTLTLEETTLPLPLTNG
jgi:hypothetical protein